MTEKIPISLFKQCIRRAAKFTAAYVAVLACALISPAVAGAQDADPTVPHTSDDTTVYNEDYFKNITYTWVDDSGVMRVSNLAQPALEYNQIVAFIREVYLNPRVPGFIEDKAWDSSLDDANYPNKYVKVPYEPCLAEGNPYGMDENTVVPTPVEGCTALMVELVDDYEYVTGASCEELIKKIKRITLLTQSRYIDETVSPTNPGTLFNYVGALNNFFLVTKGNNRIAKEEAKKDGFPPFYNMFEEYSPSNHLPIYDAFQKMNAGESFSVDHNCTTIMGQNHIIVMSPEPEKGKPIDEELYHDYGLNFMFFLPDYRFARDTRRHPDSSASDYVGEWYTYYSAEHQPYFFFNKIKTTIGKDPEIVVGADGKATAKVSVSWSSSYNDIVHYQAMEDFYIYRVVNDVIQPEPINLKEMIDQGLCELVQPTTEYALNDDGSITTKIKTISVIFHEPCDRFAYGVSYIVTGRRYLTDFEFTESNVVSNTIPGQVDPPGALNIVIEGERKSEHKIAEQRNYYTHTIRMLDSEEAIDNVTLAKKHLRAGSEEGVLTGTTFKLMRYADDNKDDATAVASLEITKSFKDQWDQWEFEYVITDLTSGKTYSELGYKLPAKTIFKSPIIYKDEAKTIDTEATDNALILAPQDSKGILATFYDNFSVDTSVGLHPGMYHYYIDYEPAVLTDGNEPIEFDALSNVVEFLVPHNTLKAGYVTYSRAQIEAEAEYDTRLPENSPGLQFSTTTNPNVETYTVYRMANTSTPIRVARATRMPTGRLSIERATGPTSTMKYYSSTYKIENPIVEVPSAAALTDNEYVLVVKYNNGNTYGNRITGLSDLPRPVIKYVRVSANDDKTNGDDTKFLGWFLWYKNGDPAGQPALMSLNEDDQTFQHIGYRVWRKRHGSDMDLDFASQSHSFLCEEFDYQDYDAPHSAPMRAASDYYYGDPKTEVLDDGGLLHSEPFTAHVPSVQSPVNYQAHVRLYTQLPQEMSISDDPESSYVVSDTNDQFGLTTYRLMTTGLESLETEDADAPVEYFNLQGQRILNPQPGTIVIRRQGSKVSKIFYQ